MSSSRKRLLIFALLIVVFVVLHKQIIDAILLLLLSGSIYGTPIRIPFWVMMAIYCALITLIVTHVIESRYKHHTTIRRNQTRRRQMPRRRYSQL